MTMTDADPVDTALAEKVDIVTGAHLAVAIMMTIAEAAIVLLQELAVLLLTTIHLHVAATKIHTVAISLLIHTSMAMADLPMIDLPQETILLGSLLMAMTIVDDIG